MKYAKVGEGGGGEGRTGSEPEGTRNLVRRSENKRIMIIVLES